MNRTPKSLEDFLKEVSQIEELLSKMIWKVSKSVPAEILLRVYRAEWHIKGLIYHFNNLIEKYGEFSKSALMRIDGDYKRIDGSEVEKIIPDIVVMYEPEIQKLFFELYAFVNLAKITLDNISKLLYPLFTNKHLPKSITAFSSLTTNCPVYERLSDDGYISYLIDLRNCIVHYRTFATNDNILVLREGVDEPETEGASDWFKPMARAYYRISEEGKIMINIYLPDKIFNEQGSEKLATFTFDEKFNVISFTIRVLRIISMSIVESISYYNDLSPRFEYKKDGFDEKVEYIILDIT